ncbi:MAG TPA: hypothetical protein VL993_04995 [Stellaceae bacterium]|nr:hypothetical protein [Stellaceae bacterium]
MVWLDANPLPPMGKPEIVVAPVAGERSAQAPARKPTVVVAKAQPRESAPNAPRTRGNIVDILA